MKTKNRILFHLLIVMCLVLILFDSCKKEEPTAIPLISTIGITDITATTATSGGNISSDGRATITARGVCWSTSANPYTSDPKTGDGTGTGQFVSNIIGLTAGTTYHVRAYATNSAGTAYGADISFSTLGGPPESLTQPATNITISAATLNGTVNAHDLSTTITFEYGTTTSYGSTIIATQSPVNGNTITNVSSDVTGLTAGTTYHFRVKATNSVGTTYGSDVTFTISGQAPTVTTTSVTTYTTVSATVGGNVTASGGATVSERGVYWGTSQNPETTGVKLQIGSGIGIFSGTLNALSPNATYYVRAYATNSHGTSLGDQVSFTTQSSSSNEIVFNPNLTYGTLSDVDGNTYKTIQIGTQTWMAENLKTSKYNDGTAIPNETVNATWNALNTGAYCDWDNTPANSITYGRIYNWYTVDNYATTKMASNGGKNVCPTGWHVPFVTEWMTLTDYLGGVSVAGGKLKETGTTHWWTPNKDATNETGFTALPSGYRTSDGTYHWAGLIGHWWSSTEYSTTNAYDQDMDYSNSYFSKNYSNKRNGYSVRCLKDN